MHVGLLDLYSYGHHTPSALRMSRHLVEAGHRVTFFTTRGHSRIDEFPDHDSFSVEAVPQFPIPKERWDDLVPTRTKNWRPSIPGGIQHYRAIRTAEQSDIDVLHLLTLNEHELAVSAALSNPPPFPVVATISRDHYEIGLGTDALNNVGLRSALGNGTVSKLYVHCPSQAIRIEGSIPEASGKNVETLPYPTPGPTEDLTKEEARERLDLPQDLPILHFFAGHRYEQGPDILLDAVREFDRPVAVVFAGSPGYVTGDDLDEFDATDGGEAGIVNRIGWVDEEDVYPYFVAADAAMLPFRRRRGGSETLSRACLTNTHPIASDHTDIGYTVEQYSLGQTFEHGSSDALRGTIRTFLDDRDEYPLPAIHEYGRRHRCEDAVQLFVDSYRDAIERHRSAATADRAGAAESRPTGLTGALSSVLSGDRF